MSPSHLTIPALNFGPGDPDLAPGLWAARLGALQYRTAKRSQAIKHRALQEMLLLPAKREIQIRPGRNYLPQTFEDNLNESHYHLEAAYCYMVGVVQEGESACLNCQAGQGPFPLCVRVFNCPHISNCADCHWGEKSNLGKC